MKINRKTSLQPTFALATLLGFTLLAGCRNTAPNHDDYYRSRLEQLSDQSTESSQPEAGTRY